MGLGRTPPAGPRPESSSRSEAQASVSPEEAASVQRGIAEEAALDSAGRFIARHPVWSAVIRVSA